MTVTVQQLSFFPDQAGNTSPADRSKNAVRPEDRAFHDWYRFVLSYPPHLVRRYLTEFSLPPASTVLDPFSGTGTTVVEAKLAGMVGVGLEANTFPHFASKVKTDWRIDPQLLLEQAHETADKALDNLSSQGISDLPSSLAPIVPLQTLDPAAESILIKNSISPLPLHKTLILLDCMREQEHHPFYKYGLLALGNALVNSIGNLRFGPEVGVGKKKKDAPVVAPWLAEVRRMAEDIDSVRGQTYRDCRIYLADSRNLRHVVTPQSIDAVITSPPYPNEKDYTRTTRLESVILGFISDKKELRALKKTLIRSNTRGVYKGDQDDAWVEDHDEIQSIADAIEDRRIELNKTSGFERMYSRVTRLYFGGMARHLAEMRSVLRPGAMLAYVVGDQASYLRVLIQTGKLLADIASSLGYEVVRIDLFRTRFATATQMELREEVVVLRWPG
ncbi:MAG: DNA methyltransferase [Anaerolineae bacterium]|nr:DNA methyltransferase [Anaerolineae bacterium]